MENLGNTEAELRKGVAFDKKQVLIASLKLKLITMFLIP